jgi:hypothetical protein
MIIEYIERLRREPKEVRQSAVYFWTVLIVALIVLLYIVLRVYPIVIPEPGEEARTLAAPYENR